MFLQNKDVNKLNVSLFSHELISPIVYGQLGIICKNETIRNSFANFAKEYLCQSESECEIKSYSSSKQLSKYINSQDYANDKEFDSVIEIIGTKYNSLTFNIRNKEMQVKSKYDSANTLNFQTPMNEKNENISKWKMVFHHMTHFKG